MQQALDLLKENKIAEATQLLKAVAEDKTALAEQETARASKGPEGSGDCLPQPRRHRRPRRPEAGAGGLRESRSRSIRTIWRACFGQAGFRSFAAHLNEAQTRLERVLTLAKTEDQAYYHYWALVLLGDIKKQRGDLAGALKSYNDGLAIAEPLAKSDPGNADLQRDLSVSFVKVGDVQMAQGDLAGALKSYNDSPRHCGAPREILSRQCGVPARSFGVLRESRRRSSGPG